jgi:hypothetical protein
MATKHYKFTGPVKWAKVWPGQVDRKYAEDKKGGNWSIILQLGDQLAFFNALGTKLKAARLDDPERGISKGDVQFRRYERHPKMGELGPPAVKGVDEGTMIGNGSICEVEIAVYDYPAPDGTRGFAVRLVGVDVKELIKFEPVKADTGEDIPF